MGFAKLFERGRIGALYLPNRIVMPAMATGMAGRDGGVTDALLGHYARRSAGGVGMVITEITNVHSSGSVPGNLDASDDRFCSGLTELASAIKSGGARAIAQLYHPGRQTWSRATGHALLAPSAIGTLPANEVPEAASTEMLGEIVESFIKAAERVALCGFDGVEIHGAHGYLICTFLSPAANKRDDEYGGDTRRRARLATDIVRGIRKRLGGDFPIIFRLSAEEGVPAGIDLREAVAIARLVEDAGANAVHVSSGCYEAFHRVVPPMWMPLACNSSSAAALRRSLRLPVIVAGRISDPALAESLLVEGVADFVAVGRGLLSDPDFALKARAGRADEIRECVACNTCIDTVLAGKPIRCLQNTEVGREGLPVFERAETSKRVTVIGGGPAGMQAAITLASRGHQVTLWERENALGGKLPLCAAVEWKQGFERLAYRLAREVERCGVLVKLSTEATTERVLDERPDAVVLATGAEPVVPSVPGIENRSVLAEAVLRQRVATGQRVFIMGGGYTACELALQLARRGHGVTMARRGARFGAEFGRAARWWLMPQLEQHGVQMLAGVNYVAVESGGIVIRRNGVEELVPYDTLVIATGYRPRAELATALSEAMREVHLIGDCRSARSLLEAMHEGVEVALRI